MLKAVRYSPTPVTIPNIAKSHMLAAVVNPNVLSLVLINAPAPKKPIPVTTAPNSGRGFSISMMVAVIASPQAPTATKINAPKPIGLWDFCLSIPKINDSANVIINLDTITNVSIVSGLM